MTSADANCVIGSESIYDTDAAATLSGTWLTQSGGDLSVVHATRGMKNIKMKYTYGSSNFETNSFNVKVDCPALSPNDNTAVGTTHTYSVPATTAGAKS